MAPPPEGLNLDIEAISGIFGSISIACWVVVFSPQIVENFRRGSADGLSLQFVIVWLLGDVFNILGAVLQGVLPTMIILAVYYTIADLVLLGQCFYYRGFTWKDEVVMPAPKPHRHHDQQASRRAALRRHEDAEDTDYIEQEAALISPSADERTSLLAATDGFGAGTVEPSRDRRGSNWSHLSPAVPMIDDAPPPLPPPPPTRLQAALFNLLAVLMVCAAGVAGWFLSRRYYYHGGDDIDTDPSDHGDDAVLRFDLWGQIFGWLCAVLYLGSRLPQLLLNWRRKSTEGVSMLFFLFACLGNLTYVLSIFAFEPVCAGPDSGPGVGASPGRPVHECDPGEAAQLYGRYLLVNASWLAGSLGTLLLDMGIFVQFFMYNQVDEHDDDDYGSDDGFEEEDGEAARWDDRPVLERHQSNYSR